MPKFLLYIVIAVVSVLGLVASGIGFFFATIPDSSNIRGCLTTQMFHVRLCPQDPTYVKLGSISPNARNAAIVSEDGAFFSHHGFDWDEMKMSVQKNLKEHEYARGGSTITQQLAKNVYLSGEKSLLRKAREALITMQLEKNLSKNEILEKYFNVVQYGENLYGIGRASQFYFHKSARDLTPAEGAFLAFLLPNPIKYSASFRNKQLSPFALHQTRIILDRMHHYNRITDGEYESALVQVATLFGGAPPAAEPSLDEDVAPSPEEQGPPPDESSSQIDIVL